MRGLAVRGVGTIAVLTLDDGTPMRHIGANYSNLLTA